MNRRGFLSGMVAAPVVAVTPRSAEPEGVEDERARERERHPMLHITAPAGVISDEDRRAILDLFERPTVLRSPARSAHRVGMKRYATIEDLATLYVPEPGAHGGADEVFRSALRAADIIIAERFPPLSTPFPSPLTPRSPPR